MLNLPEYSSLIIMAVVSVVVLFIISKLLGKKQIAQLEFIDYAIGISIGSIAAEMATDISDKPIQYYIIAMLIFFLFDVFISLIGRKSPVLKHFLKGRPLTVIYDGEIDYKVLKKSKLDVNDIISMCRELGYFDITKIAYGIFENSGHLSVMPISAQAPTVAENLDIPLEKASLPYYLVVDGRISFSSLYELEKDKEWLYKELKITTDSELKNVLFACYDDKKKITNFTLKKPAK